MNRFQAFILRLIARCVGIRGDAYICMLVYEQDLPDDFIAVFDDEPTINDIAKNNEEDAMNRVRENN